MTEPWQLRVIGEYMALDEKITRLEAFLSSTTFLMLPQPERLSLYHQRCHMKGYKAALAERIGRFPPPLGIELGFVTEAEAGTVERREKPTIEELEAILVEFEGCYAVQIKPDGSIHSVLTGLPGQTTSSGGAP